MTDFVPFPKVPRLSREIIITEKLDGTNASVWIEEMNFPENPFNMDKDCFVAVEDDCDYAIAAASRNRFITPGKGTDNHGFAAWVRDNAGELVKLGPGIHHGEWWGQGIQCGYGLKEKRFSLFNTGRWASLHTDRFADEEKAPDGKVFAPACCHVVPVVDTGLFNTITINEAFWMLYDNGSIAAPGFISPEGIMIYHTAANQYFKKTYKNDEGGKGQ